MKRFVLLALLALALPLSAFANTWDFTNINGALAGNALGMSLVGSNVINIDGPGLFACPCTESFTTGPGLPPFPISLNLPTVFAAGGNFTITGAAGVIFNGTFTSPVTWTPEQNGIYQISGHVSGILVGVGKVSGFTSQLYFGTVVGGVFTGTLGSGDTILSTPEPGTLGLLGTGLVGLAGIVRKKLKT